MEKIKLKNKNDISLLINFQTYLLTEKFLSDNSINSYVLDISKYLNYLEKNNLNYKDIHEENIDRPWFSVLSTGGWPSLPRSWPGASTASSRASTAS